MNRLPSVALIDELLIARDELVAERDLARRVAITLETETAMHVKTLTVLRMLHHETEDGWCTECQRDFPCRTRRTADDTLTAIGWEPV